MILDTTSKTIEVILPGAITTNQLEITADWVDTANGNSFVPGGTSLLTNGGAAVTAVPAPGAGLQRQVKALTIYNADTVNQTPTIRMFDGTNRRRFVALAIAPGQALVFTPENGWTVMPSAPGQIIGTSINDNAAAGCVGEFLSASATGVAMTSGADKTIASIPLTGGDWNVWGIMNYSGAASTTLLYTIAAISDTTNTITGTLGDDCREFYNNAAVFAIFSLNLPTPMVRKSVPSGGQTAFLVAEAGFGVSTLSCGGIIKARRVR